ncbi:MAG: tyrosine-type recombinase/integrase [Candidatus Omnitrophota bacterium]
MATLRHRNGNYFIDYRVNGRRFRKKVGRSKRIAELALKDIEVKVAKGELGFEVKDSDLEKLFVEFLQYSQTNHAPSSQKRYRAILDNFKSFLKNYPYLTKISHLMPKLFEDYKAFRKENEAANKTVNIELQTLGTMLNLAIKWGYATSNPVKGIGRLKEDNHKKPRFLSKEECKQLLEGCGDNLYPIFYTFLNTGMRKSELEHLEWSDIDFERRKIKIQVKDNWKPKTIEREIPINDGLLEVLKQHRASSRNGCSFVFHKKSKPIEPNSLRKKLMTITKNCGFADVTKLHSLRHTFASHLVMNGVDLPTVKKLMGHSDIQTTMIYSHLADEHVDKAVEKLVF